MTTGQPQLARRQQSTGAALNLASSVWLPWLGGLSLLLLLGVVELVLLGRTSAPLNVPRGLLDAQELVTNSAAESARRGLNEGVDDIEQLAISLEQPPSRTPSVESLARVKDLHGRYLALSLVDAASRTVVVHVGEPTAVGALGARLPTEIGMHDAVAVDDVPFPVIAQFAPVSSEGAARQLLVGQYDPRFLRFPLGVAESGSAWVVNAKGQVIYSLGGFQPFEQLPRMALRQAAASAAKGEFGSKVTGGSIDRREIVAWAPLAGDGPAGHLGWGVVTARTVETIALPENDFRRQGRLAGMILVLVTLVVFGWLLVVVFRPLRRVQGEAERVAIGDLRQPVFAARYDEIGLIARALERIRLSLIRRRSDDRPSD